VVTLADISPDALELARENAVMLHTRHPSFVQSDLFGAIDGTFDGIVANLPYVPEAERATLARELTHEPPLALFSGADGLALIRRFIPSAFHHLHPGAWLVMEIGHDQASQVAEMLHAASFTAIEVKTDMAGTARFPRAKRPLC